MRIFLVIMASLLIFFTYTYSYKKGYKDGFEVGHWKGQKLQAELETFIYNCEVYDCEKPKKVWIFNDEAHEPPIEIERW